MIKSVLFDLDNTLLNRDVSVKKFIELQYERLHKYIERVPKEKYITRFIELDDRGYVWKDKVYQQLTDELAMEAISWEELLQDYLANFKYCCVPFNHLVEMLDALKGCNITLGMITNGYGQFQMDNIKALGIEEKFEVILISEWEGIKKPNPFIFEKAAERLGAIPNQCVFVGDHPINDIRAANEVGMKSIWKKDSQWDSSEADFSIDILIEIPLIIEKINKSV
ncbi:HAD family hydrolase [Pseudogracilibacillus sp. SO30301A]|uniref:HAD family hydrolase n=1 Tax=Pseudogracilibacillus sp. SO30301A TaxID=3098291 RepID=UPI00300E269C